jgi:hypothetical protein
MTSMSEMTAVYVVFLMALRFLCLLMGFMIEVQSILNIIPAISDIRFFILIPD